MRPLLRGAGRGAPILLVHPPRATASTWGSATEELARVGRGLPTTVGVTPCPAANRRARSSRIRPTPQRFLSPAGPARRRGRYRAPGPRSRPRRGASPDLVRVVVAHEFPWRFTRHLPSVSHRGAGQDRVAAIRGRQGDAAETLLRSAYTYRDGGRVGCLSRGVAAGRQGKRAAALADFRNSITDYPSPTDLATVEVPVVQLRGT